MMVCGMVDSSSFRSWSGDGARACKLGPFHSWSSDEGALYG
jgi:hypothetical protein